MENIVNLKASLTRPPSIRKTSKGKPVIEATFGVQSLRPNGVPTIQYVPARFMSGNAEEALKLLTPGLGLDIQGHITQERWTDAKGEKHSKIIVHVDHFKPCEAGSYQNEVDVKGGKRMQKGVNKATIVGTLTRAPRFIPIAGKEDMAEAEIVFYEAYQDREGNTVKRENYLKIIIPNELTASVRKLKKGDRFGAKGLLKNEKWIKDNTVKTTIKLDAEEIILN